MRAALSVLCLAIALRSVIAQAAINYDLLNPSAFNPLTPVILPPIPANSDYTACPAPVISVTDGQVIVGKSLTVSGATTAACPHVAITLDIVSRLLDADSGGTWSTTFSGLANGVHALRVYYLSNNRYTSAQTTRVSFTTVSVPVVSNGSRRRQRKRTRLQDCTEAEELCPQGYFRGRLRYKCVPRGDCDVEKRV